MSEIPQSKSMWHWLPSLLLVISLLAGAAAAHFSAYQVHPPRWTYLGYALSEAAIGVMWLSPTIPFPQKWRIVFCGFALLLSAANLYQFFFSKG